MSEFLGTGVTSADGARPLWRPTLAWTVPMTAAFCLLSGIAAAALGLEFVLNGRTPFAAWHLASAVRWGTCVSLIVLPPAVVCLFCRLPRVPIAIAAALVTAAVSFVSSFLYFLALASASC